MQDKEWRPPLHQFRSNLHADIALWAVLRSVGLSVRRLTSCCRPWAQAMWSRHFLVVVVVGAPCRERSSPEGDWRTASDLRLLPNDTFARFVLYVLIVVFLRIRPQGCSRLRDAPLAAPRG